MKFSLFIILLEISISNVIHYHFHSQNNRKLAGICFIKKKQYNFSEEIGKVDYYGRVMKKHYNFYEEVGKLDGDRIMIKHSNFYEEVGKVDNSGRIMKKHSNFYEEVGKIGNFDSI